MRSFVLHCKNVRSGGGAGEATEEVELKLGVDFNRIIDQPFILFILQVKYRRPLSRELVSLQIQIMQMNNLIHEK